MVVFVILAIGLMVTLVVAKGLMQAQDYAADELSKQGSSPEGKVPED